MDLPQISNSKSNANRALDGYSVVDLEVAPRKVGDVRTVAMLLALVYQGAGHVYGSAVIQNCIRHQEHEQ